MGLDSAGVPASDGSPIQLPRNASAIIPATDLGGAPVLKRGDVFLLTNASGDMVPDEHGLGLYVGDTRVLSHLALEIDGGGLDVLRPDPGGADHGTIVLTNPDMSPDPGDEPAWVGPLGRRAFGIIRERHIDRGLQERLSLANYRGRPETPTIDLLFDADMADIFEVRGLVRVRRGTFAPTEVRGDVAVFDYLGLDGRHRRTRVTAVGVRIEPAPEGSSAALRARWQPEVGPGDHVTLTWSIRPEVPDVAWGSAEPLPDDAPAGPSAAATVHSDDPEFDRVVARGIADLRLLVTPGPGPGQRFLAAGIPWFTALFGRDAIFASLGALIVDPSLAVDTLRALASLQATADDPARDAEPGKMPHEVRRGEMAATGEVPFGCYYGSADATPLWLVLLGETYDWTGDLGLVQELWPHALAALRWMGRHGDADGDGFIEYRQRAPRGLLQHGWKDAPDAIRDRDGRIGEGAIALAEVQGYAYDARVRAARLARAVGDPGLARQLDRDARRLRTRFEAAFWVRDRATYALALDGRKRPMDAIGSNQGHALWSGIVDAEYAAAVARQLAGPGLDSGWGLRTYAAGEPGYNPLGYHTGTVWPHDTAIAVAGLRRAGFDDEAIHLSGELFDAARAFPGARLPELFCGFGRQELGPPVPYPAACAPQAWAAAAPLAILRALLGIRPRAAEHRLDLERPRLPAGVTSLRLSGLRIGDALVDLGCRRRGASTRVEASVTGEMQVTILA